MDAFVTEINDMITNKVKDMRYMTASEAGLDHRSGCIYISESCIVTEADRSLQFFSGFDTIPAKHRNTIGKYVIYSGEHERVAGIINRCLTEQHMA